MPYFGGTLPSGFALPQGQNLSATSFPAANAVLGTTYGNPGGGNFTMPDLRGRFFFNLDSGGSNRLSSVISSSSTLGATGGGQNQTIAQANLPNVNFAVSGISLTNGAITGTMSTTNVIGGNDNAFDVGTSGVTANITSTQLSLSSAVSVSAQGAAASGGSGTALPTVPPAMGVNCMMRIA